MTHDRAAEFDENNLEKESPHCYCKGDTFVSEEKFVAYDPDEIDEVECPHCNGRGTTGLVGDFCRYCRGSQFLTLDKKKYKPENID